MRLFISNFRDIRNFTIIVFCVVLLGISLFECALRNLGELVSYDKVLRLQEKENGLFSPKYSNVKADYKILGINHHQPDTIVLGTSRLMEMRQYMFPADIKFYNANIDASVGKGLKGVMQILRAVDDEAMPKTIILELDSWTFNPNYPFNVSDSSFKGRVKMFLKENSFASILNKGYLAFQERISAYGMLLDETHNISPFLFDKKNHTGVGLNAKIFNAGFAYEDGSFYYPQDRQTEPVKTLQEWQRYLATNTYRFTPADKIDEGALKLLREMLDFASQRKIRVIGILPPFRGDFLTALESVDTHSAYTTKFRKRIPEVFSQYGFQCYDFTSPELLDLSLDDFSDKMHVYEYVMAKIVNRLALSN